MLPLAELLAFNLTPLTGGADGIVLPPKYVLHPAYYCAIGLGVATFIATGLLAASRFGYALRSIRNDELAAEIVGIRIFPKKLYVLVLSALFAALAGAVYAALVPAAGPGAVGVSRVVRVALKLSTERDRLTVTTAVASLDEGTSVQH